MLWFRVYGRREMLSTRDRRYKMAYKRDISVYKNANGSWVLTYISDQGDYVKQVYYFYTKSAATIKFLDFLKEAGY
jgi:hypothetical protein